MWRNQSLSQLTSLPVDDQNFKAPVSLTPVVPHFNFLVYGLSHLRHYAYCVLSVLIGPL